MLARLESDRLRGVGRALEGRRAARRGRPRGGTAAAAASPTTWRRRRSSRATSARRRRAASSIAEAALAQAQAEPAYAEAQLQNTVIRAPFAGTVVKKMAEVGESVAPIPPGVNISTASGAIVALADLETLEVEADVSEANVAKLGEGQPAEVTVEAFPDRRYKAVLRQVIPTADRTKATVLVKVTILDKDKDLKPEMSAKVTLPRAEQTARKPRPRAPQPVMLVPRGGRRDPRRQADGVRWSGRPGARRARS